MILDGLDEATSEKIQNDISNRVNKVFSRRKMKLYQVYLTKKEIELIQRRMTTGHITLDDIEKSILEQLENAREVTPMMKKGYTHGEWLDAFEHRTSMKTAGYHVDDLIREHVINYIIEEQGIENIPCLFTDIPPQPKGHTLEPTYEQCQVCPIKGDCPDEIKTPRDEN